MIELTKNVREKKLEQKGEEKGGRRAGGAAQQAHFMRYH